MPVKVSLAVYGVFTKSKRFVLRVPAFKEGVMDGGGQGSCDRIAVKTRRRDIYEQLS